MDYVKERVLGRGSFGTVYLISIRPSVVGNGIIHRRVLKEILINDEEQCYHARKEVQILSQLHHPNIIQYFDSFEAPGGGDVSTGRMLCIAMEFCSGGDLVGIIARRRGIPFPEEQVLNWFKQLVSALDHLHQRKILHRDVKTGNIFANADASVLKLGDFGNARLLERNSQMANTCVGTPNYLSPEICGRREYSYKTDIWSLGCVLYQLLTLRPPFSGRNIHHLLTQILRGHFLPMPPRYSYELRNTVYKIMLPQIKFDTILKSVFHELGVSNVTEKSRRTTVSRNPVTQTFLHCASIIAKAAIDNAEAGLISPG